MYITNGQVFLPEGRFEKADILCGDRITAISGGDTQVTVQELTDGEMIDATGNISFRDLWIFIHMER